MATSDQINDLASNPPIDHGTVWLVLTAISHVVSGAAILGALVGVLPALSAVGALVWYILQIWETKTVQRWAIDHGLRKRKPKRKSRARPRRKTPTVKARKRS